MAGFYDFFDVAVVGGGHAGIEASLASARIGLKTVLITQNIDSIGRLSCNPSIGGIAKGNIVREIDALGGEMGKIIDKSMIQFRLLNRRRGPAVQAPRAQADKILYSQIARKTVETTENLSTLMDSVTDILTAVSSAKLPPQSDSIAEKGSIPGELRSIKTSEAAKSGMRQKVTGIVTERGRIIPVRAVVLTTGTFLGGKIFIGDYDAPCGRLGEEGAFGLTQSLIRLGFTIGRLKTGTPPRILRHTVDFTKLAEQPSDEDIIPFSFDNEKIERPMVSCHIAYTNTKTHNIIRENIGRSPLYSGKISGIGPRYCPSIEDKVMRFSERERHQIFVEPEGLETDEIYLNGLSSSLPESVQDAFLRTMEGFENAVVARPGYAVEYDYVEPTQLYPSLETKRVAGLFNAGQINGTSGYEEAAGQGLIAGINAALYSKAHKEFCGPLCALNEDTGGNPLMLNERIEKFQKKAGFTNFRIIPDWKPVILHRSEAYIGVLIDDLVTLGTKEPYRMFTARAEYRLKLRFDTADQRLCRYGFYAGLKTRSQLHAVNEKYALEDRIIAELLKNPKMQNPGYPQKVWETAQIDFKYKYYIEKQDKRVEKLRRMENTKIPVNFDYGSIPSLSSESRQKLEKIRPLTLGQAGRISGIRNSDIMLLMVYLR
ncbi:tRNA uridine-5-carboxymethylaminomethyl modification enzyme MnmG/GidA [Treponema parvum]|uniref:tRNA uridine-5-carboxymethylaminomethyl modification enzyme MnmG/GidA n=1 Tax=Treponema parvum TaxID=138851 RepID=UPI001AEC5DF1|nr:FAD-dependent oxidoreductase [Treponema parvum]QTQ15376.1 tRNA uridine-5-carboxymethylaminomethyl(34) synthesis enzyme MnmG [Treponema parvum]